MANGSRFDAMVTGQQPASRFDDMVRGEGPPPEPSAEGAFDEMATRSRFDEMVTAPPTFVGEARRALTSGLHRAATAMGELAMTPMQMALQALTGDKQLDPFAEVIQPFAEQVKPERPETAPGQIGEALVQFLAPFGLSSKAFKAGQATTRMGRIARTEAAALTAEQIAFDPHEQRLSNLIQQFPQLANPITDFLEAEEDDTEAEARFKMAAESLGIGATIGAFTEGLRAIRRSRKAAPPPEPAPTVDAQVAQEQEQLIDLSTNIEAAKRVGEVPTPRPSAQPLPPNLNTARLDTTEDVTDELLRVSRQHDNFTPARRGVVSHEETRRLADTMGLTEKQLLGLRKGATLSAHEALSARQMLLDSGEKLVGLAKTAEGGDETALFEFKRALTKHAAIQERVSAITAEAGRALNQFNIMAKSPAALRTAAIRELSDLRGGDIKRQAQQIAQMETPEQIARFARDAAKPRLMDKVLEVWINGLLSGPQTHAVNMLSNTLVAGWTVPEQLVAAGIGAVRRGPDRVRAQEAAARAYGFVAGGRDGVRAFWEAVKDPDSVPIGLGTKLETRPRALGDNTFSQIVNIPGRLLSAEDRLFQSIGYRMELQQRAMASGLQQGLRGRALARHITETLANTPDDIAAAAQGAARYQTFTNPVGIIAGSASKIADRFPALRFIFPFIRTPTNILKFAAERSPLGFFTERYKDAIKQGGRAADIARARIALGSSVGAMTMQWALDGTITGFGPSDPESRALWRETHQPYSVKIGDEWVSYQRIEPLGMLLGISADAADVIRQLDADDPEIDKISASIAASVSQNLTSKTWLKGISDLIKATSEPGRYGESWIQAYAGSAVPTGVAQVARIQDPILRDTRDVLERIRSRLPGLSQDLPPVRNLFGEPIVLEGGLGPDIISPLWTKAIKSKPLAEEMQRLQVRIGRPQRKISGIELTPQQYSAFSRDAGRASAQAALSLIRSPGYQALPDGVKRDQLKDVFTAMRRLWRTVYAAQLNIPAQAAQQQVEEIFE